MKLGWLDIQKFRDWPHKPNIKSFVSNLTFLKSIKISLILRNFKLFLFVNKILNNIFDLALVFIGNLYLSRSTSGRFLMKLSSNFFIYALSSIRFIIDCPFS